MADDSRRPVVIPARDVEWHPGESLSWQGECAYESFAREEAKKPPHLRSAGAWLVCHCPKCSGRVIA
jgi:hypothetical protein